MKHLIFGLGLILLLTSCERKVNTLNEHDQSGATEASKLGAGNHGTAPRSAGDEPSTPTATATDTKAPRP